MQHVSLSLSCNELACLVAYSHTFTGAASHERSKPVVECHWLHVDNGNEVYDCSIPLYSILAFNVSHRV